MSKPKDPIRMFDTRTIERNIKYGWLSRAELEKHYAGLPDVSHKGVTLGEIEDRRGREAAAAAAAAAPAPAPAAPAPAPAPVAPPVTAPAAPAAPSDPFGGPGTGGGSGSNSGF